MHMGEAARATGPAGQPRQPRSKPLNRDLVVTADGFSLEDEEGESAYELREGAGAILAADAPLRAFVDETCAEIREVFGTSGELAIARYQDPDAPESGPSLYLLVRTTLEASIAGPLLDRFDEAWWLDNAPRAQGKLEVSLEFA